MKRYNARSDSPQNGEKISFRREWAIALFCLLMATALPALTALLCGLGARSATEELSEESDILICRHGGEAAEKVTLEHLLTLSLAATNSSDTPAASLEAQAVLLRSRAVWWLDYCRGGQEADSAKEEVADGAGNRATADGSLKTLCDSPAHGLPYCSQGELTQLYGSAEAEARIAAALQAVATTHGQVLCYDGEVVPALLHHSSPGSTRSVESLPWLAAVPTPEEGMITVCRLTAEEARAALAARFGLLLPASPAEWEMTLNRTDTGMVETVSAGGETLSGTVFADALSLPSGSFTVEVAEDALLFTCTGWGSGCGLSREGAAIYAAGGLSYAEILAHYYPDCTVGVLWK